MSLMGRLTTTVSRFVALSVTIYGAWMFAINVVELDYAGVVLAWILLSGLAGVVGGVVYLLSLDGPERFRTRRWRMLGWSLMLACVLLPTSLQLLLVPAVVVALPGFLLKPGPAATPREASTSR